MKLYLKNMVCQRCILMVKSVFEKHGLHIIAIKLGEVEISETEIKQGKTKLTHALNTIGFEIIDDKKSRITEKIKALIVDLVHTKNGALKVNLSDFLSSELNQEYSALSHLFSEVENQTIEKFFIAHKIERVKELIIYDQMNLSEIAFLLNYSSVGHVSNQFKKITGYSPTQFKKLTEKERKTLDTL